MKQLLITSVAVLGVLIAAVIDISGMCSAPSAHYVMGYFCGILVGLLMGVL